MAMPSFAFSVHNFISSVGADAGFAAAIGLAILILLYFAHARETANLREQAALLTQRLQQAEARVAQLSQPAVSPPVAPAPTRAAALAPFAPAGTAAPAIASATRVIPVALPSPQPAVVTPTAMPVVAPVPALAMAGVGAGAAPPAAPAPAPVPPPSPEPRSSEPSTLGPATAAGGNGAASPPPAVTGPGWSQRGAAARPRGSTSGRFLPPPLEIPRSRPRRRLGRAVAVALTAIVIVAVAVGLFAVTSIGGSPKKRRPSTNSTTAGAAGAFKPSSVTVAVLNGTTTYQLAHRIAGRLAALGYKQGTIATAANQTQAATVVAYRSGTNDRRDAMHVARALKLRESAVRRVDPSTLQVACPALSTCSANVVVTVGSDLATQ